MDADKQSGSSYKNCRIRAVFFVILIFFKPADIYEYLKKNFLFNNSVFFYKISLEILFAEKNYGTRPCYITAYF